MLKHCGSADTSSCADLRCLFISHAQKCACSEYCSCTVYICAELRCLIIARVPAMCGAEMFGYCPCTEVCLQSPVLIDWPPLLLQSDVLVRAAAVFLDHWYRRAENIECNHLFVMADGQYCHGIVLIPADIDNGCGTSLKLLDVHFVRLLSVILSEMEPPSVPTSLLCRSHLKAVMHPF